MQLQYRETRLTSAGIRQRQRWFELRVLSLQYYQTLHGTHSAVELCSEAPVRQKSLGALNQKVLL